MQIVNLYRYEETNDSIAITPNKRNNSDIPYCYRLIADNGMILKNGDIETPCIDVLETGDWVEQIDDSYSQEPDEATTEDLYSALAELGVE